MKKICLLFAFTVVISLAFSQTLFTYGNTAVDKGEFIRAYNKNKTVVPDRAKALQEYLDLYVKFKLKVKAALDLKLDTMPQLLYDAQSFRSQIVDSYLNNQKAIDDLLAEAFTRSQKDLHSLHFFVPVDAAMQPADTLKAFKAISDIYLKLNAGKTDYPSIVAEQAAAKAKQSDLGFITAFTLPYEYETIVYNLKTGQTSKPYRSKNGWHIFKVTADRPAVGKWKVAQILISIPPDATEADKLLYKQKADSVYALVIKGSDFGKMVRQVSDDKVTLANYGEIPEFGSGKFDMSFEDEIFKLKKDGDITKPFLSPYGYHIVKRLSHSPVSADKNDPGIQFDLKQKIQQDSRVNIAKDLFTKEVFKQVGYKKSPAITDADLYRYADSAIANPNAQTNNTAAFPISNKQICSFGKTTLTGKDWLDFVRSYKAGELYRGETNAAMLDILISGTVVDYYKTHLEDYNTDFRYQMEEFRDGNMLFEIMEKNIWGKASADTAALQKLYAENKNKYLWAASADIILFTCANKSVAEEARAALKQGKDWVKIMDESNNNIQADSGRFETSQLPVVFDAKTSVGTITEISVNDIDNSASFIKLVRYYNAGLQRNFDESRGLVINDYQNLLEEKWIANLKSKYPVKVNESVFQSLLK